MSRETFKGCLVQGGLTGLAVLALYGLVSNMSWENYEANQRLRDQEDAEPYRPPEPANQPAPQQTMPETAPFSVNPSQNEQPADNCAEYPDGVRHRGDVCINGMCGATFFGRRGPGIETSWRVEWFDQEGKKHELSCEEVSRDAIIPDPNN